MTGDYDVADCMDAITHFMAQQPERINPNKIYYFGGSHGGFIGGHMSARDSRIKASVLYNPVLDISTMVGTTDIPDWTFVETGTSAPSADTSKAMFEASPIFHINSIKIPILFILGTDDRRVPNSQAINFYGLLREKGLKTRLLSYPGEPHRIERVEHVVDLYFNIILWFQQS